MNSGSYKKLWNMFHFDFRTLSYKNPADVLGFFYSKILDI